MPAARSGGVAIVGAGPTGLILAAELGRAGVRCVVAERRPGPRADSRPKCLHARPMETPDLRGRAENLAAAGLAVPSCPLGPRGAKVRFGILDSDFPHMLDLPQSRIEPLLRDRAVKLGAEVRWSATVTSIEQDDTVVTIGLADGSREQAEYVS